MLINAKKGVKYQYEVEIMDTIFVQTVWRIMEELRDANQLETALAGSLDILKDVTKAEEGVIWMLDDQSERIIAVSSAGPTDYTGMSVALGEGIIGDVVKSGATKVCGKGETFGYVFDGTDELSVENALVIPLKTPISTLGCIQLINAEDGFSEDAIKVCENSSSVLALDIEDKGLTFRPFEDRTPLVQVRNVVKEFMNGEEVRRILKGVDLDVYSGELVIVLGESGCGKSTLLNIIGGMDTMTSGQLLVEGKDMSNPTEEELTEYRRKYIGFIFQSYNLMPNLSAYENIEFIAEISDEPLDSMEALELVGLDEKADRLPSALSGGQMQRVSIARALVKDPKIILADEPTAALDYETSIKVLSVIERIARERKTTVIMVTHNPEIAKMANRVIKIRDGKISSIRVNLHPMSATELVW